MEADEFISIAREKINENPFSRLSELTKSTLNKPDSIVDIHAHIFDKNAYLSHISYFAI